MHRKLRLHTLVLVLCSTFFLCCAHAQYRAGIQGTVTDPSGAVISGAKVAVTNQETGKTTEVTSSEVGFYSVTNIPPGPYTVSAEAPGFKKQVVNDTVVTETVLGLNLSLATGAASEQVVVTGDSIPAIQTENANLEATISTRAVQALPQFRGDPYELLRVTPGVFGEGARNPDGGAANLPNAAGTGGSIFGIYQTENTVQVSANGQRTDSNGYTLDGVSTNSQAHGGATVLTPNQESIQEVKVEVNAYDAENGHSAGALVQTVSKSGTNDLHGSFGFRYHSPALNAYQRWGGPNTGCTDPRGHILSSCQQQERLFIRNYFGSVGAPIIKNRLFAFFSFDHQRTYGSHLDTNWVETPQLISSLPSGSIASQLFAIKGSGFNNPTAAGLPAVPGTQPPGQSPACFALGLVDTATGLAGANCTAISNNTADIGSPTGTPGTIVNSALGGGLDGTPDVQFIQYTDFPDVTNATQFNGRMDFQATNKDLVAFTVYKSPFLKTFLPGGWVDGRQYDTFHTDAQHNVATLLWTRTINSTMVNEARANVTHWYFDELKGNPQAPWGLPSGSISAANQGIGVGFFSTPGVFHQATYAFRDTLSKVHNSHVLKFGGSFDKEQNNTHNTWAAHPSYNFNNLWSFANDAPSSQNTSTFDPKTGDITQFAKYVRVNDFALFAQDNWKARPSLTLTFGLRWDYFTPIHDTQDQLSHLVLGQGANTLLNLKVAQGGNLSQADRNNFGPQLGFAWSPKSVLGKDFSNRLVWRGGIGVAYTKVGEAVQLNASGNPPSFVAAGLNSSQLIYGTSSGGPYAFNGYPANPNVIQQFDPTSGLPLPNGNPFYAPPSLTGPVQNLRTPYTLHYSLEMQYDLGHQWTTSLSYQGSQSRKMERTLNYRLFGYAVPQQDPAFCTPDPLNPRKCDLFNTVNVIQSDGNSGYNALLARVTHRFSHGLEVNANYRYSKSIDFCSYDESCGNQQSYPTNQSFERGPSDFDVTHSFTGYALYELPFFKGRHNWLETVAGGWKISPIITLNSGFPWTPVFDYNGATCSRLQLQGITCTLRPAAYLGGAGNDYSTGTFQKSGGNFPNGSLSYFTVPPPLTPGPNIPGIGRNGFRGPRYTGIDMGFGKRFVLPRMPIVGEDAGIEVKATVFNIFNKVNALPFGWNSPSTIIGTADPDSFAAQTPPQPCTVGNGCISQNSTFGRATGAFSGRVIELTARFSF